MYFGTIQFSIHVLFLLGATIISAVAVGLKQETALRFSFMLYIPVSLGGVVLGFTDFLEEPNKADLTLPNLVAFIATLPQIEFVISFLQLE